MAVVEVVVRLLVRGVWDHADGMRDELLRGTDRAQVVAQWLHGETGGGREKGLNK